MKKLINLIALVMLVSVNVLTPFSYAGTENEVGNPGSNEVISEDEEVILENGVRIVENEMDIVENDQNLLSSGGDAQILVNNSPNGELFVGGADSGENLEDTPLQSGYFTAKTIQNTATLLSGVGFRNVLVSLAGSPENIIQILYTGTMPVGVTTGLLSTQDSDVPVYGWFDNGTIYYYTEADKIYLNENSSKMFYLLYSLTEIDTRDWDTSNVTDMSDMFFECNSLETLDLSSWDISNVTRLDGVFANCTGLITLDLRGWNTSNAISMAGMFFRCISLEKIYVSTGFVTTVVTNSDNMFSQDISLVGGNGTTYDENYIDKEYARIDGVDGLSGYFTAKNVQSTATLVSGPDFNVAIRILAGDSAPINQSENTSIIQILQWTGDSIPDGVTTTGISISSSEEEVLAWFDNGTIYYYTQADKIYLNSDSSSMFVGCVNLTNISGLSSWDTSNVTNMISLFHNCRNLNNISVISGWDTSNVTNMSNMFYECDITDISGLSRWDTSNVASFDGLFAWNTNLSDISALSNWNINKLTKMTEMFYQCNNINDISPISKWDISKVTDVGSMFAGTSITNTSAISGWNTSNVTDMGGLFEDCVNLTDISGLNNWSTSNVTNMADMFAGTSITNITVLNNRDTSNVENMGGTFQNCDKLIDVDGLTHWDTSKVTDMDFLFSNCRGLTEIDLSNRDTSKVNTMYQLFYGCNNLKTIYASNKFNTDNVTSNNGGVWSGWTELFKGDIELIGGNGTTYDSGHTDKEYARIDGVNGLSGYFTAKNIQNTATFLSGIEFNQTIRRLAGQTGATYDTSTSLVKQIIQWTGNTVPTGVTTGRISTLDSEEIVAWYDSGTIYYYTDADKIYLNPDSSYMFARFGTQSSLGGLGKIDTTNWDTSKVTDMSWMFFACFQLRDVDMSNWDTSNVIDMNHMFDYGGGGDVSNWDVSKVENMSYMFLYSSPGGDISNWNTSSVTNMEGMFAYSSVSGLDLSNWDMGSILNMQYMFSNSQIKTLDITNWNISTYSNVIGLRGMFAGCSKLKTIYANHGFPVFHPYEGVVEVFTGMFSGCTNLVGGNGTTYDANHTDVTYARVDKEGQTGYFTDKTSFTVKFISNIDQSQSTVTVSKGQKLTLPAVNGYDAKGGYSDSAMTKQINLENGVDGYTEIYVKYERKSSGGGGGGGGGGSGGGGSSSSSSSSNNEKTDKNSTGSVSTGTNVKTNTGDNKVNTGTNKDTKDSLVDSNQGQKNNSQNGVNNQNTSNYSEEWENAYNFAYKNGITTMPTIEKAQMYKGLTRIAMAKMLSQYAINVLGKTPDKTKNIKFNDVSDEMDKDYNNGVTLAYQLGIMGINMKNNNFRPDDTITRAEFATALSRLLYNTPDGNPYYITHLQKLKKEGIILNDNPNMKESRGYVMIMLMRSAK